MSSFVRKHLPFPFIVLCFTVLLQGLALAAMPVEHPALQVRSAYEAATSQTRIWSGFAGGAAGSPAYPGVLRIVPGENWANFVSAAPAGVYYSLKNVVMMKTAPVSPRCTELFPDSTISQSGTYNIRLVWPLIYEAPGTTWTLTVAYGTNTAWDDDGPGPNPPSYMHTETWQWTLGADVAHLKQLVMLFHDTAFAKSAVPVISDETLYTSLLATLDAALAAESASDYAGARTQLEQFRTDCQNACIATPPMYPDSMGPGTGIANTPDNPACCKLQLEVDYILANAPYSGGGTPLQVKPATEADPRPGTAQPSAAPTTMPVEHDSIPVSSAIPGNSAGNPVEYRGLNGVAAGPVTLPGVLGIVPGENWANFVTAAQHTVPYDLKNIAFRRETPDRVACSDVFPYSVLSQQGGYNVRLWWPLIYEPAGTAYTLTIMYGTYSAWDDDGPEGPNPPNYVHTERWTWVVHPDPSALGNQISLFHDLPLGGSGVPLISDEDLYQGLLAGAESAKISLDDSDSVAAGTALAEMASDLEMGAISMWPPSPFPRWTGTGIAAMPENPALCKLLTDIGFVRLENGVYNVHGGSPLAHDETLVYAAYPGDLEDTARTFSGYAGAQGGSAPFPGFFDMVPGDNWSSFIGAAQAGVPHTMLGDVSLELQTGQSMMCSDFFPVTRIQQAGDDNIRLHWPLLYATPNSTWTLRVTCETPTPWDDDGPVGPNPPTYLHTDVWQWRVEANLYSMRDRLRLYRDAPGGQSGTPLISDEALYSQIMSKLDDVEDAVDEEDILTAAMLLSEAELLVLDGCTTAVPEDPGPESSGIGILNTIENPACCALLEDMVYVGLNLGLFVPAKTARGVGPKPAAAVVTAEAGGGNSILHPTQMVHPASLGSSLGIPTAFMGYQGDMEGQAAFPGVLAIEPGENWANFVAAAQSEVAYTLGEVKLSKFFPKLEQCSDGLPSGRLEQTGDGIRLRWPLLYDTADTLYVLTLEFSTATPQQFPGETEPSLNHLEAWSWKVEGDVYQLRSLTALLHAMPWGTSGVPIVSDEYFYSSMLEQIDEAVAAFDASDLVTFGLVLGDLTMYVMDECLPFMPMTPAPGGPGTGIAHSAENPACCRLITYIEEVMWGDEVGWHSCESPRAAASETLDGQMVGFESPLIVSLAGDGWFYAQTADRSSGIKVLSETPVVPGNRVLVRGEMDTDGPERVIHAGTLEVSSGEPPRALGMPARFVGGRGQRLLPGFSGVSGLWNGGLRVMVFGKVSSVGDGFFYLQDGTGCSDGTGYEGLRIILPVGATPPNQHDVVKVTGVSSWFDAEGLARPAVLAGDGGVQPPN